MPNAGSPPPGAGSALGACLLRPGTPSTEGAGRGRCSLLWPPPPPERPVPAGAAVAGMGLGSSSQVPDGGAEGFHVHGVRRPPAGPRGGGAAVRGGREGRPRCCRGPAAPLLPAVAQAGRARQGRGRWARGGGAVSPGPPPVGSVQGAATAAGEERPRRSRWAVGTRPGRFPGPGAFACRALAAGEPGGAFGASFKGFEIV